MGSLFRKILKWLGITFGVVGGIILVSLGFLYSITDRELNKIYEIPDERITIPSDAASIARGKHLVENVAFCSQCHGENMAGQVFDDGALTGRLRVANLTPGRGGIPEGYADQDWVAAIRHGVSSSGKSLIGMWSNYYFTFSDDDLGAIIAYLKTLPPVDNEMPPTRLGPMGRLLVLQDPTILPARVIDHFAARPPAPEPGPTPEYGAYLATFCKMCHGENYAGGLEEGSGGNITTGGNLEGYTLPGFIQTFRTGVNPRGKELDPDLMPWKQVGRLSDMELEAIFRYLQTVPPVIALKTPVPYP